MLLHHKWRKISSLLNGFKGMSKPLKFPLPKTQNITIKKKND